MIKIIPNKIKRKQEPQYKLCVTIGIGSSCDDTYIENTRVIVDSTKGTFDKWNYIKTKEAEELYTFFKSILSRDKCSHIVLNDAWELNVKDSPSTFWYDDFMNEKEIKKFAKFYKKYQDLFNSHVDHEWYGIVGINIYYYDEYGEKYNCEVV